MLDNYLSFIQIVSSKMLVTANAEGWQSPVERGGLENR